MEASSSRGNGSRKFCVPRRWRQTAHTTLGGKARMRVKRHITEANRERQCKCDRAKANLFTLRRKAGTYQTSAQFEVRISSLFSNPPSFSLRSWKGEATSTVTKRSVIGLGGGRSLLAFCVADFRHLTEFIHSTFSICLCLTSYLSSDFPVE